MESKDVDINLLSIDEVKNFEGSYFVYGYYLLFLLLLDLNNWQMNDLS